MNENNNTEIKLLGLSRSISMDLDYTNITFKQNFKKEVAEKSFFTSFKRGKEMYHGTLDGKHFTIKERRGLLGGKKILPTIKGSILEVNGKTKLEIGITTDLTTLLPYLISILVFGSILYFNQNKLPTIIFIMVPVYFLLNFFFLRHAVKKTSEQLPEQLKNW